jgi:predicted NBD/HSP70 family sugar kinase
MMNKAIGVDIGGTKTSIGLIQNGSILKKEEISTETKFGGEKILSRIIAHITPLLDKDIKGIGIGAAGQKVKDFICIAIGTGVGGAIISNGALIRGSHGAAGEIGHMIIHDNGRYCPCGKKVVLKPTHLELH